MTRATLSDLLTALRANPAHQNDGLTVLTMDVSQIQNSWQRLLPAGFFSAVDGRPFDVPSKKWFLDAATAAALVAQVRAATNELVIDYEHQTLMASQNGQPAPAAGWFKDVEWREGSGLWIRPRWTERAMEYIRAGEYRYLSAVFPYNAITGQPTALHSAALVNRAGLDGVTEIGALSALVSRAIPTIPEARHSFVYEKLDELSAAEASTISLAYLSAKEYLDRRDRYCRQNGASWDALTALTPEDHHVIRLTGKDPDSFRAAKLQALAEKAIRST